MPDIFFPDLQDGGGENPHNPGARRRLHRAPLPLPSYILETEHEKEEGRNPCQLPKAEVNTGDAPSSS